MNKSIRKIVLTLLISLITAVYASAAAMEATVVSTKGKTEVQKGSAWKPLQVGSVLHRGDVIQTGFKSELILKIKNTTVTVAPLSRITIEQLASKSDKDDTRLFLDTGSLKSDVKKTEDRRVGFTVRSPVATASVRGTVLQVKNTFGGTDIIGIDGSTAAWKAVSKQSAAVAADDEETEAVTGNDAAAISDGQSGAGASLVRKNMKASFTASSQTTPMSNAAKTSADIGGVKDTPSAVVEKPVATEPVPDTPDPAPTKTSVTVTVSVE